MARARRRLASAVAAVLLGAAAAGAGAADLRTLHVDALRMHADRTRVHVGEVFHLAIRARVREHVTALDELVVPDVGSMLLEGDERSVTSSPAGTDVIETLTLEPTQPGTVTLSGAYLDAIDATTGKPSRFSANAVRIVVDPPASTYAEPARLLVQMLAILAGAVLLAAAVLALALAARSGRVRLPKRAGAAPKPRPRAVPQQPPPPAVAPPAPRTQRDVVRDALRVYRDTPTIAALKPLRAALFAAAGTREGGTLRDALTTTHEPSLRAALTAAERTAFGPASLRDRAASDLIVATEDWLQ